LGQDPWAKSLIPSFTECLEQAIAGVDVQVLKPTQTMPLGDDNAACVICFATSFNDESSLKKSVWIDCSVESWPKTVK
jgi:hypothetical protein